MSDRMLIRRHVTDEHIRAIARDEAQGAIARLIPSEPAPVNAETIERLIRSALAKRDTWRSRLWRLLRSRFKGH